MRRATLAAAPEALYWWVVGHHHEHHGAERLPARVLSFALALTASFMVVEAAVGWWSRSLALVADAGHMLADTGSILLGLLAHRWSRRPPDQRSTYGYRRAEVLAAFVNGILLALTALFVVKEAIARWIEPEVIRGPGMLVTAVAGLVVNGVVALTLLGAKTSSVNVRAVFAHVVVDAVGSVGAIVAGLAVVLYRAYRVDPVLSIFIAALVAHSGWRVLREATAILLEAVPAHLDAGHIARTIQSCPGVASLHDLHVWRVSDGFDVLTVHVTLQSGCHGPDVCRTVAHAMRERHGIDHVTVQPEAPLPTQLVPLRRQRANHPT
jgi:cobalt-zinc-cadmium efflux system protein